MKRLVLVQQTYLWDYRFMVMTQPLNGSSIGSKKLVGYFSFPFFPFRSHFFFSFPEFSSFLKRKGNPLNGWYILVTRELQEMNSIVPWNANTRCKIFDRIGSLRPSINWTLKFCRPGNCPRTSARGHKRKPKNVKINKNKKK